jgi:hypothetical protein
MTVVMTAVMGLLALTIVATASLGGLYAARSQAMSAADAAALAAAVATYPGVARSSPRLEASRVASLNGAFLVSCRCPMDASLTMRVVEVIVGVSVDAPLFGELTVRVGSRAEFDPEAWLGR